MAALLSAFGLFASAWLLHVLWWRCRLPKNHTGALLLVFGATPPVAALLWLACGSPFLFGVQDLPGIALFYLGAVGCYLITYTAVEETSPSLAIFGALKAAGNAGLSHDELASVITDDNFVRPRLEALRRDGILAAANSGYLLSARGKNAVRLAILISHFFNVQKNA